MEVASSQPKLQKCRHFSIRGYVSEVRKKNMELCQPFSTEVKLPSLRVPDFNYWACETRAENVVVENLEIFDPHNTGLKPCVTSSFATVHTTSEKDASVHILGSQQAREETFEKKSADVSTAVYVNDVENKTPLCIDLQDGSPQPPRETTFEAKKDDATASVYITDVENNIPCIDLQSGSQHGFEENNFDQKTVDTSGAISVNEIGNNNSLGVDDQAKEGEVREDAYRPRDDDVAAAARNNPPETYKNDGAQDASPSENHDGTVTNAKDSKIEKPQGFRGNVLTKKRKRSKKGVSDSGRRKMAEVDTRKSEPVNAKDHKSETRSIELDKSGGDVLKKENTTARHGKKKTRRRSLNILIQNTPNVSAESMVDIVEIDSGDSNRRIDAWIDLNLTPKDDEDEGEAEVENEMTSIEKDVPKRVEEQSTPIVNDQILLSSSMEKGKMPIHEDRVSFMTTSQGDSSRGVQFTDETAIARGLYSETEAPMAAQSNGGDILGNKNRSVNSQGFDGKLQLMGPKRCSMLRAETGGSSLIHQPENRDMPSWANIPRQQLDQRASEISERASSDDIPMDIVELMARNQHERRLGTSGSSNFLSNNALDAHESPGNLLRFLHERKLEMRKTPPMQSDGYVSELSSSRPNVFLSPPGQSHAPKGFASFSQNRDKPLGRSQLFVGSCSRNGQNQEKPSSGPQLFVGSSTRNSGGQNPTFPQNHSGAQFPLGGSCFSRDYGYQNSTFSKNQERPSSGCGDQFFFGSRNCGNQTSTFSQNYDKLLTRAQFPLDQNSNWAGHCVSQPPLQTSEPAPWQNPFRGDRHAWMPNRMPFGIDDSNSQNKRSQCLELFPKGNTNGDNREKYVGPFANHLERRKSEYPFAFRERGIQFSPQPVRPQPVRPMDLYNNEKIPATQLLRLMDAGICPSAPINVDENDSEHLTPQPPLPRLHRQWHIPSFGHLKNDDPVGSSAPPQLDPLVSSKQPLSPRGSSPAKLALKGKAKAKEVSPTQPESSRSKKSVAGNGRNRQSLGKRSRRSEFCYMSRNPADFTLPVQENEYMISYEDLKRSAPMEPVKNKRQKMLKITDMKK